MREFSGHGLRAHAGPRIAAFPDRVVERTRPTDAWQMQFRRPRHFGFRSFTELIPWSIVRRRPRELWKLGLVATLALSTLILILGVPFYLAFLPLLVPGFFAWRARRSPFARSRRHAARLESRLANGAELEVLREECERTLLLDPDNDAARLLLAALLIQGEEDRAALLQLAPLRDHRPESGEVVLLAAACYLHLGRPSAALEMLDALDPEYGGRARLASIRLQRAAMHQAGIARRSELSRPRSPLAEDLFDDELY